LLGKGRARQHLVHQTLDKTRQPTGCILFSTERCQYLLASQQHARCYASERAALSYADTSSARWFALVATHGGHRSVTAITARSSAAGNCQSEMERENDISQATSLQASKSSTLPQLLSVIKCVSSKSPAPCSESTRATGRALRAQVCSKTFLSLCCCCRSLIIIERQSP
jgi:hypothetical protein